MPTAEDIVQNITLSGQDEVIASFGEIGRAGAEAFKHIAEAAGPAGEVLGTIAVAFSGLIGATALWAHHSAEAVHSTELIAQQAGSSVEEISALQSAIAALGGSSEGLSHAFRRMGFNISREWDQIKKQITADTDNVIQNNLKVDKAEQALFNAKQAREKAFGLPGADAATLRTQKQKEATTAQEEAEENLHLAEKKRDEDRLNSPKAYGQALKEIIGGQKDFAEASKEANLSTENIYKGLIINTEGAADALKNFNGNLNSLAGEGPKTLEVFKNLADFMKNAHNATQEQAIMMRAFGRYMGEGLVAALKQGGDAFVKQAEDAKRAGLVITEDMLQPAMDFHAAFARLASDLSTVTTQMGLLFAPTFTQGMQDFTKYIEENHEALLNWASEIADKVKPYIQGFFDSLTGLAAYLSGNKEGLSPNAAAWEASWERIGAVVTRVAGIIRSTLGGITSILEQVTGATGLKPFEASLLALGGLAVWKTLGSTIGRAILAGIAIELTGGLALLIPGLPSFIMRGFRGAAPAEVPGGVPTTAPSPGGTVVLGPSQAPRIVPGAPPQVQGMRLPAPSMVGTGLMAVPAPIPKPGLFTGTTLGGILRLLGFGAAVGGAYYGDVTREADPFEKSMDLITKRLHEAKASENEFVQVQGLLSQANREHAEQLTRINKLLEERTITVTEYIQKLQLMVLGEAGVKKARDEEEKKRKEAEAPAFPPALGTPERSRLEKMGFRFPPTEPGKFSEQEQRALAKKGVRFAPPPTEEELVHEPAGLPSAAMAEPEREPTGLPTPQVSTFDVARPRADAAAAAAQEKAAADALKAAADAANEREAKASAPSLTPQQILEQSFQQLQQRQGGGLGIPTQQDPAAAMGKITAPADNTALSLGKIPAPADGVASGLSRLQTILNSLQLPAAPQAQPATSERPPPMEITPKKAGGGEIGGWGSGTSDSVPIMASVGEFIIKADGSNLGDAITYFDGKHAGGLVGYQDGGEVDGRYEQFPESENIEDRRTEEGSGRTIARASSATAAQIATGFEKMGRTALDYLGVKAEPGSLPEQAGIESIPARGLKGFLTEGPGTGDIKGWHRRYMQPGGTKGDYWQGGEVSLKNVLLGTTALSGYQDGGEVAQFGPMFDEDERRRRREEERRKRDEEKRRQLPPGWIRHPSGALQGPDGKFYDPDTGQPAVVIPPGPRDEERVPLPRQRPLPAGPRNVDDDFEPGEAGRILRERHNLPRPPPGKYWVKNPETGKWELQPGLETKVPLRGGETPVHLPPVKNVPSKPSEDDPGGIWHWEWDPRKNKWTRQPGPVPGGYKFLPGTSAITGGIAPIPVAGIPIAYGGPSPETVEAIRKRREELRKKRLEAERYALDYGAPPGYGFHPFRLPYDPYTYVPPEPGEEYGGGPGPIGNFAGGGIVGRFLQHLANGGIVGGGGISGSFSTPNIDMSAALAHLSQGLSPSGPLGEGFAQTIRNMLSSYSTTLGTRPNYIGAGGFGDALGFHQLDIRTSAGAFSAAVSQETIEALQGSSLGGKLTQIGQRPTWFS